MAYTATSLSTVNGEAPPTSNFSSSLSRYPKLPRVITSLPPSPNPSSAPTRASPLPNTPNSLFPTHAPSNASSPAGTPLQTPTDGFFGRITSYPLTSPGPLELGEPVMDSTSHVNASGGDTIIPNPNKSPGLMRRISRGAANKLTRRRPSATQNDKRDRSSGPVIMRRRRDSKTSAKTSRESAIDSSNDNEDDSIEALDSLGAWRGSEPSMLPSKNGVHSDGGVAAPKADPAIQHGTLLTKVTKKRRKQVRFFLDLDAAKVYWDATNSAKRFYVDDMKEIRVGTDARNYREEHQISEDAESRWFTIIISDSERSKGRTVKILHLIAPTRRILELWTTTLENISRYRIGLMAGLAGSGQSEAILMAHWQREIARFFPQGLKPDEEESLDFDAVESVCRSLHINCSHNMLRAQFSKADAGQKGSLDFMEFKDFLTRLKERKDIKEIYKTHAVDSKAGLTLDEFLSFLQNEQKEDVDSHRAYWTSIFEKSVRRHKSRALNVPKNSSEPPRMSLEAFSAFVSSASNGIYASSPPKSRFDRPLNEYFISSSHNTYLLGRQVAGASSTEAYITALTQGCRCVEIDCWDGADGRPNVSHGRTMTTSVLFADCVSVINRYAFITCDFPVILSLEVHCNPDQQLAMVKIMKDTFKEKLILEPLVGSSSVLPSPEKLKGRILVKVKTCDETEGGMRQEPTPSYTPTGRKRSSSSPFMRPSAADLSMSANLPLSSPPTIGLDGPGPMLSQDRRSHTTTSMSSATEDSDGALMTIQKEKKRRQKSKITKPLSDLGVYTKGYKWHSFTSTESQRYNHVYSFAERSFEGICRDPENKALFEKHNRKYLTRVYPSGFRLRSSNFDPLNFWRRGVQMAALNWQTYDIGMQMNQAMFAAGTDRTGYILKPESLRMPDPLDTTKKLKTERKLVQFSVDVISAQQLPRPSSFGPDDNINPYVEIEMFSADDRSQNLVVGEGGMNASARNGISGLGFPHRRRTKIEQSNGYSPVFNDRFRLSLQTKYPDLVFVRWVVWSSPDGRISGNNSVQLAAFTAKLSSLSQGYRYLPLCDSSGDQFLFSTLFCKITKQDPISISVQQTETDELRAERMGILRQISQTMFKRNASSERDKDQQSEKGSESHHSTEEKDAISPSLTPTVSATSTSSITQS